MSNSNYVLSTGDKFKYNFFPYSSDNNHSGCVQFRIKAAHNAHIALCNQAAAKGCPLYEVVIGGWNNTKSVIRKNKTTVAETLTRNILDDSKSRGFVIRWDSGSITVSQERTQANQIEKPFLSWNLSEPVPIKYIGVSTGWGASGKWTIQPDQCKADVPDGTNVDNHNWVEARDGQIPPGSFVGGKDHGERMYVARAMINGGLIPGKLVKSHREAYIPWGGLGTPSQEYQVLCDFSGEWLANSGDNIPPKAFPAGESEESETLYIGRVLHEDDVIVGKFHPKHRVLYVVHKGSEEKFSDFEVLCRK